MWTANPLSSGRVQTLLARTLTKRYLIALGSIALIALLGDVLVQATLSNQARATDEIKRASSLRQLSQSLGREAVAIQLVSRARETQAHLAALRELSRQMGELHPSLRHGANAETAEGQRLLTGLQPSYEAMQAATQKLVANEARELSRRATGKFELLFLARKLVLEEAVYRKGIDSLVTFYEAQAAHQIDRLKRTATVLFLLTLFVLLVEGLFIFRPAIAWLSELVSKLEASEARKRAILEWSPDPILTMDLHGEVIEVNPAVQRVLGYAPNDLLHRRITEVLVAPDQRQSSGIFFTPYLSEQGAARLNKRFEAKVQRADGTEALVEGTVVPTFKGRNPVFTAFLKDITRRKRAEEEMKRSVEALARSNEELQRFAYVASHDLQEPLRMVSSYMNLLGQRYKGKLDSDADEFIHFAADGAMRMRELIKSLLSYSRAQQTPGDLVPADCNRLAAEALSDLKLAVQESGAHVRIETLPAVMGNAPLLRQLFQNLLSNALKFRGERVPELVVSAERRDREWVVSVQDNGIGLPMEEAERIFEAFQRLHGKQEYPGSGLGLAICKKIVESHGGRLWVQSTPGRGATFFFSLPAVPTEEISEATEKELPPEERPHPSSAGSSHRQYH